MTKNLNEEINDLASQCVKCGLCLPHCPTYELSQNENESPRGRIALMQAMAQESLQPSQTVVAHLDRCLSCRNCERVCPAHVQYGELIDYGRLWLKQNKPKLYRTSFKSRLLQGLVANLRLLGLAGKFLRMLQLLKIRSLAKLLGVPYLLGLSRLDQLLPPVPSQKPWPNLIKTRAELTQGHVGLFLGCLARWSDRETAEATVYVYTTCGFNVSIPKSQGCCGAMAHHAGNFQQAHQLLKKNSEAFVMQKLDAIVSTASGCGSMLQDSKLYYDEKKIEEMASKIIDASHFIQDKIPEQKLKLLNYKVALHTPCTLNNGMHQHQAAAKILDLIPGLSWFALSKNQTCCGSAGTYMLEQQQWSDALVSNLLKKLDEIEVDFVVTSNIGCALHLRKALIARRKSIKVVHPMVLLAKSLGWKP